MSTEEKSVLPITFESFKRDAKNFFLLDDNQIHKLFDDLESKQTSLSIAYSHQFLKKKLAEVTGVRTLLIFLIHKLYQKRDRQSKLLEELKSIDIPENKIKLVFDRVYGLNKDVIAAVETLYDIMQYRFRTPRMIGLTATINYTPLNEEDKETVTLFPLVRLKIKVRDDREDKNLYFEMPLNEFEGLALELNEMVEILKANVKIVKPALGSKLATTIGDDI